MSLITQCPACATHFKVVSDQLRVSQGWVRCGQCDEVFDANAHLRSLEEGVDDQAATDPLRVTEDAEKYSWEGVLDLPEQPSPDVAPSDVTAADDFLHKSPQELVDSPGFIAHQDLNEDAASGTDTSSGAGVFGIDAGIDAQFAVQAPTHSQDDPPLSFLRNSAPDQNRRRVAKRVPWAVTMGLLGIVLLLQVTLHERHWLAAQYPGLKPALVGLCAPFSCQVMAYQQIEAIVIDSSAFSKTLPDVFKLSFTLKNTGPLAVAMPALELTLTDSQDQVALRKVLSVHDMGHKGETLGAEEEFSVSLPVSVKMPAQGAKMSGYRLVAFYP